MKTQGNKSERRRLKQRTFANLDDLFFQMALNCKGRSSISINSENKSQRTCGKYQYQRISNVSWLT